jgi:hypothetical protein
MLKPRWDGGQWQETATPEEIESTRPPLPDPETLPLTPQRIKEKLGDHEQLLDITMLAGAELYENALKLEEALDITQLAVCGLYEMIIGSRKA